MAERTSTCWLTRPGWGWNLVSNAKLELNNEHVYEDHRVDVALLKGKIQKVFQETYPKEDNKAFYEYGAKVTFTVSVSYTKGFGRVSGEINSVTLSSSPKLTPTATPSDVNRSGEGTSAGRHY